MPLRDTVEMKYKYVVERQPIGRALFKQFCEETSPELSRCWQFLELVEEYETNVTQIF
jgi:G protein-coupled receptor kinase